MKKARRDFFLVDESRGNQKIKSGYKKKKKDRRAIWRKIDCVDIQ